ncbi:MAG TPA: glycerol-3-phosphate 1-O-acyltransferase PlsY [Pyrinomonadaceae bacterium]|nr:glycerol-3-phosphate 1-O-acyltransferase PlsY [Pyrinomonadaceae bacterium]
MRPVLLILISYLLGSIPFGYLIVRALEGGDIRQTGSGGTGATNVSRRAGKAAGVLTLLLDGLKGATAVMITMWVFGLLRNASSGIQIVGENTNVFWWVAASLIAVLLGHIFPIWLRFRGGKGVATGVGGFLVLTPLAVLGALLIFVGIVFLKRYISLGSITAALAIPLLVWLGHLSIKPLPAPAPILTAAIAGALLIVFAHRENIRRLVEGKESKFK